MPAFGISWGEIVINTMFYFFCCEVAALLTVFLTMTIYLILPSQGLVRAKTKSDGKEWVVTW